MMLPKLSGGVTRSGPTGRARGGVLPSPPVTLAHCLYTCNDGTTGCADGESTAGLGAAKNNAYSNAQAFCNNGHGGLQSGTTYPDECLTKP